MLADKVCTLAYAIYNQTNPFGCCYWHNMMVDAVKFWISDQWIALLSTLGCWQLIQLRLPSCGVNVTSELQWRSTHIQNISKDEFWSPMQLQQQQQQQLLWRHTISYQRVASFSQYFGLLTTEIQCHLPSYGNNLTSKLKYRSTYIQNISVGHLLSCGNNLSSKLKNRSIHIQNITAGLGLDQQRMHLGRQCSSSSYARQKQSTRPRLRTLIIILLCKPHPARALS